MTVAATSDFELTVEQLSTVAAQFAGMLDTSGELDPDDAQVLRRILGMELDALQAEGVVLRTVERTTQALVASTAAYTLSADTIDVVIGPNRVAGTIVNANSAETQVVAISGHDYTTTITNKTNTAVSPTHVLIEKQASVILTFWPVPSGTTTFRYQKIRLPKDGDPGSVTLDLARRWQKALCWAMAWQYAKAKRAPQQEWQAMYKVAEDEKAKVRNHDTESGGFQFFIPRM